MKNAHLALLPVFVLLGLPPSGVAAHSVAPQDVRTEAEQARRAAILATAERYATFRWSGSEANAFHGEDPDGIRVDTADDSLDATGWQLDGGESQGMPYCWGGFTSIEEFHEGLAAGRYAGLVPGSERAFSSRFAMGLDCSGFVARVWNLPQKQSTRSLGALSYELASYDELLPGDILNKFDSHVALFVGFADAERTRVRVIEAARIKVVEAVYEADLLRSRGFVPMRYKPLDARWMPMEELEAVFEVGDGEEPGRFVPDGTEATLADVPGALRDARAGEWARYAKTENRWPGLPLTSTRMVARVTADDVEVQAIHEQEGMELMRGARRGATASSSTALMDFAGFVEPLRDLSVVVATVENGTYELGSRSFPARRITAVLEGNLLSRHKLFPGWTEIRAIQSDAVPLQGILEAEYRTEITWSTDEEGERRISQETKTFRLTAFGGGAHADRTAAAREAVAVDALGSPAANFERQHGGPAYDRGVHVSPLEDGRFVVTGVTESFGAGGQDVWLVLCDAEGEVLWSRTHGGAGADNGWCVLPTEAGFVIAGFTDSFGAGGYDFYLVKTDSEGEQVWSRTYGGEKQDRAWALAPAADGGFLLVGESDSEGAGQRDGFLVRTDAEGNELWSRTYGGAQDDRLFSVAPAEGGGYVLAGQTFSEGAGDRDAWVVAVDDAGEEQWSKTFGGARSDVAHAVCRTKDDGFFVTGYTTSFAETGDDPYLIRLAPDGTVYWERVVPLPGVSRTITGEQAADGGFYCVGFSPTAADWSKGTALLLKTDADGEPQWHRSFFPGTGGESVAYTVRALAKGGCVFTGHATDAGGTDLVLARFAEDESDE